MKKVSLLIAMIAFVFGNLFAQSYNFDQYNVGDKVAQTIGQPWSTWSDNPGSPEDAVFSDEQAASGTTSVKFTYNNDQIFNFNDLTTGAYTLDWKMYIPNGKDAHVNIQHNFTGAQSGQWAFGLYFNHSDGPMLHVSDEEHPFTFPFDTWFPVHFDIDLDRDAISLTIDGVEVHSWAFSQQESDTMPGMRVLDAIDFYPPTSASKSVFYIDDFSFVSLQAEEELIGESFEEYTVGNKIAAEAVAAGHEWWTTWSNNPGGSNDGVVSDDFASEGSNSGKISGNTDQVLLLGGYEAGVFDFEFDMYTPEGKDGYFNMLHTFDGSNSSWAMQVYVNAEADSTNNNSWHSPGHGSVFAAGANVADIPAVYDEWMHFLVHVDCDIDEATLYFNDTFIYTWQWSENSFGHAADEEGLSRKIDGANFYAGLSTTMFYIDNIRFTKIGGESAPAMAVNYDAIYQELDTDETGTQTLAILNEGNSIGDWYGYIDFGHGEGGSQQEEIYWDNGEPTNLSGLATPNFLEIANKFPVSAYAGLTMGTKLKSVKYFVANDTDGVLGFTGDLYLRAYNVTLAGTPGELLAEVIIPDSLIVVNEWNTGTFTEDIWLTGQDVFVSAAFQQIENDGYPVVLDNSPMTPGVRYLSVGGDNVWYLVDDVWENSNNNFCLHAVCEGTPIPGSWVSMDKNHGSLLGGTADEITFTFNALGLSVGEEHHAVLLINTSDVENPEFNIPVTLEIGTTAVEESVQQLASIYPNPATSQVTLEGENLNSVAIYNVAGQLVRVVKLDNLVNTIDMNVEDGVYFFSIYDNDGNNSVQRVVITK